MMCTMAGEDIVALLRSPGSHDQQRYAANECHSPDKGRKRNGLLCVDRGLERAEVDHLFPGCIGDALVRERHDAEHDERDAEYRCCFHGQVLSREATQPCSFA